MEYYIIGSISVGIVTYLSVSRPVIKELEAEGYDSLDESKHPSLTMLALVIVYTLIAPLMLFCGLFTSNEQMRKHYRERILDNKK